MPPTTSRGSHAICDPLTISVMVRKLYAKWMYAWETALTTRDTNRIVRPVEWGFDWLKDFRVPVSCPILERRPGDLRDNEP